MCVWHFGKYLEILQCQERPKDFVSVCVCVPVYVCLSVFMGVCVCVFAFTQERGSADSRLFQSGD